jgi:hypothetical protein
MLRFGKHKGKSIKEVLKNDSQYVRWLIKTNLIHKLDDEDKETISYYITPLKDINLNDITEQGLIDILKQRGLLFTAYEYGDRNYDTIHYTIDSVYGYVCGSISSMCNVAVQSCLKRDIIQHFIEHSSKISQLFEENALSLSM